LAVTANFAANLCFKSGQLMLLSDTLGSIKWQLLPFYASRHTSRPNDASKSGQGMIQVTLRLEPSFGPFGQAMVQITGPAEIVVSRSVREILVLAADWWGRLRQQDQLQSLQ